MPLDLSRMSHNCPFVQTHIFLQDFSDPLFFLLSFPGFPPTSGTIHQYHHSNKNSLMVSCLLKSKSTRVVSHCRKFQRERQELRISVGSALSFSVRYISPEGHALHSGSKGHISFLSKFCAVFAVGNCCQEKIGLDLLHK